jgi:hypothetical protein
MSGWVGPVPANGHPKVRVNSSALKTELQRCNQNLTVSFLKINAIPINICGIKLKSYMVIQNSQFIFK